ncbi:zinc ribbon domain-containing protein [Dickeya dadantii]|uniref:zinc ribbon domain-containing protein n=1 Tax=Dickeya dadantii TaxID=204038 RepID=UPI0037C0BE9E
MLEYKCAWCRVSLLKVGRREPSSKRCSAFGEINIDLRLSMNSGYGTAHHRDINAAINIAAMEV